MRDHERIREPTHHRIIQTGNMQSPRDILNQLKVARMLVPIYEVRRPFQKKFVFSSYAHFSLQETLKTPWGLLSLLVTNSAHGFWSMMFENARHLAFHKRF